MSLESIQQNAKGLIEALYQYENSKKRKEKEEALNHVKVLIDGIRNSLAEEKKQNAR